MACHWGRPGLAYELDRLGKTERLAKMAFTRVERAAIQPVEAAAGKDHIELRPALMQLVGKFETAAPGA